MPHHAEHSLFFEKARPLRHSAGCLSLALFVLVLNAGAHSLVFSLGAGAVASVLLAFAYAKGQRRLAPAVTWILSILSLAGLGSVVLQWDPDKSARAAARLWCGVAWTLWLGTQLDWPSLRGLFLRIKIPPALIQTLDQSLAHGVLTQREWSRRRDAGRLRLGKKHLPLAAWGPLLGAGAAQAFLRLEETESQASLRQLAPTHTPSDLGVALHGIVVKRGGHEVLSGLDLELQASESILLCGPSGAGKSSLLRLLAGLDGPTHGKLLRLGSEVSPTSPLKGRLDGRIALLTQNPEHHFIASIVADDIAWGLLRRGTSPAQAKEMAQQMAQALHIEHLLNRPHHTLSFGEQRRAALAGLLVLQPKLLLLDEPTAGLDPLSAKRLLSLVHQMVEQTGASCVWATHDLHLPAPASRIVLLRNGKIIFDGPTQDGLKAPWLIRAGLAEEQMNL